MLTPDRLQCIVRDLEVLAVESQSTLSPGALARVLRCDIAALGRLLLVLERFGHIRRSKIGDNLKITLTKEEVDVLVGASIPASSGASGAMPCQTHQQRPGQTLAATGGRRLLAGMRELTGCKDFEAEDSLMDAAGYYAAAVGAPL